MKGQATSGSSREGESTDAQRRDGAACSSDEGFVMKLERRGCVVQPRPWANWKREESVDEAKPFKIPKREVWEAFKRVKANQGTVPPSESQALRPLVSMSWQRPNIGSRVTREGHARFWERPGVKLPRATRLGRVKTP